MQAQGGAESGPRMCVAGVICPPRKPLGHMSYMLRLPAMDQIRHRMPREGLPYCIGVGTLPVSRCAGGAVLSQAARQAAAAAEHRRAHARAPRVADPAEAHLAVGQALVGEPDKAVHLGGWRVV